MAREKPAGNGQYGQVVERLQQIVEGLEAGELSLEESLERFAEGVALVKQGEKLLADAEKRIEQLVSEDGRAAPLKVPEQSEVAGTPAPPKAAAAARRPATTPSPPPPGGDDEDVPF